MEKITLKYTINGKINLNKLKKDLDKKLFESNKRHKKFYDNITKYEDTKYEDTNYKGPDYGPYTGHGHTNSGSMIHVYNNSSGFAGNCTCFNYIN